VQINKHVYPILTLILLVVLWIVILEVGRPHYFLQADNSVYWLPAYTLSYRSVVGDHTIPLINFHQELGGEFLSRGQTGVLYLPVYLALGLSRVLFGHEYATLDLLAAGHLLAGALGIYALARRHNIAVSLSIWGGLLWVTFPFIASLSREWIMIGYAAAYTPLVWLSLERLLEQLSLRRLLALVAVTTLYFSQGYVQHPVNLLLIESIFFLLLACGWSQYSRHEVKKKAWWWAVSVVMIFFATLPLLAPLWSVTKASSYRFDRVERRDFLDRRVTARDFGLAQILDYSFIRQHPERHNLHFGLAGLALFATLVFRPIREHYFRLPATKTYVTLAIASLLLSSYLYIVFYQVPGFNVLRWPIKFYYFFLFFGLMSLLTLCQVIVTRHNSRVAWPVQVLLAFLVIVNALIVWHYRESRFASWNIEVPPNLDLINHIGQDGRMLLYKIPAETASYRVATFMYATLFNRFQYNGYDPLIARINLEQTGSFSLNGVISDTITQARLDHFSQWAVRYLVTTSEPSTVAELEAFDTLKLIYAADDFRVYENSAAKPFVYGSDAAQKPFSYSLGINTIDIYPADWDRAQVVTVAMAPLPGWHYTVDGEAMGSISTTQGPITFVVPPQTKRVQLHFVSKPWRRGLTISALFWLLVGGFYLLTFSVKTSKSGRRG